MEFVEKRRRVFVATVVALGWVAGLVYGIALAYFIREWRTLQIVAFYPFLLVLTSYWFIPESVRWLVSRGKYRKAEEILQKAAKINRVKLHDIHLDTGEPNDSEGKSDSIIRVIKSPVLLKRFLILGINWITASMVYYGLTLNSGNLSGDVFLEFLLSSLIEIPMYILILFAVERTGRKSFHITSMCVGGLSCIITIFPVVLNKTGLQALTITLATIGKAAITAAFQMVYIYTPELFPTRLRMSVLGITSCCARIGGMAAPYVVELGKLIGGDYSTVIPLLIFGGLSLVAGLLCIMLPETKGKELPETLEEAERLISLKEKTDELYSPDEIPLNTQRLEDGLVASSPLSTTEPIESDNTERNAIPVTTISTEKLENLDLPDSHIRVEQLAVCTDSKVLFQEAKVDQPDQNEDTEVQVQNISPDEDVLDCSKSRECVKETLPENFHKGGTNVDPRDKSDLPSIETDSTNTPKSGTQDVTATDPSQTENIQKQGNDDNAGENVSPEDGSDVRRYESDKDSTDETHMDKSESAPIQNVDKVIDGKVVPMNIRNYEVEIQL